MRAPVADPRGSTHQALYWKGGVSNSTQLACLAVEQAGVSHFAALVDVRCLRMPAAYSFIHSGAEDAEEHDGDARRI